MTDRRRTASLLILPLLLAGCAGGLAASRPAGDPPAAASAAAEGATHADGVAHVDGVTHATLVGTLIDSHCYSLDRTYASDDHPTTSGTIEGCAQACASMGIPVALLTQSGEAVVLLVPSPDLADHMGHEARVVGTRVLGGSIRPDSLFVRGDGDAWTPISLHQMM